MQRACNNTTAVLYINHPPTWPLKSHSPLDFNPQTPWRAPLPQPVRTPAWRNLFTQLSTTALRNLSLSSNLSKARCTCKPRQTWRRSSLQWPRWRHPSWAVIKRLSRSRPVSQRAGTTAPRWPSRTVGWTGLRPRRTCWSLIFRRWTILRSLERTRSPRSWNLRRLVELPLRRCLYLR